MPSPDIAISTGAYAGLPLPVVLAAIREIALAAEITSYRDHTLLDIDNARAVAELQLPFSVHGPFFRVDLGSTSEPKRRAGVELHRRHLQVAAALGARSYLVHPDRQRSITPRQPAVVAALQRSLCELHELQDLYGVPVVVENMPMPGFSHFVEPGDVDLCGLGLALDVGHAAASGTLDAWLKDPRAPLRHVHLHDNHGPPGGDEHLPLGTGIVDAAAVLKVARAAGVSVVIEHTNPADVLASLDYLRVHGLA